MVKREKKLLALLVVLGTSVPVLAQDSKEPPEVTAIRESVPEIKKTLEELRGLSFTEKVNVAYQTSEEFESFIRKQLDEEITPEREGKIVRLYSRLGLVPHGYEMRQKLIDLMESQALAHYDPKEDTFYVLKTDLPQEMIDPAVLHELGHALQDQHFALGDLVEKATEAQEDDRITALRFLFEGEATYLMTAFALKQQGMGDAMLGPQLRAMGSISRERLSQLEKMQAQMMGESGKTMLAALEARDEVPLYIYRTLVDPYYKGAATVAAVMESGGWKAVDALYKRPPTSTEQVLHPEKLTGDRDEPMRVTLPDLSASFGEGFSLAESNCLGEMAMQSVFKEVSGDAALDACAGWDGDRVQSYETAGAEKATTVWFLTWDSKKDAKAFATAYKKLLFKKYDHGPVKVVDRVVVFQKDGEEHLMTLRDQNVLVVEGAPLDRSRAIMEAALAGASLTEEGAAEDEDQTELR
ncbi:hypothetical protein ACFL59_00195 [Planctomycetota bacterium]